MTLFEMMHGNKANPFKAANLAEHGAFEPAHEKLLSQLKDSNETKQMNDIIRLMLTLDRDSRIKLSPKFFDKFARAMKDIETVKEVPLLYNQS